MADNDTTKKPVRSLEDIEDKISSSPDEIDENLAGHDKSTEDDSHTADQAEDPPDTQEESADQSQTEDESEPTKPGAETNLDELAGEHLSEDEPTHIPNLKSGPNSPLYTRYSTERPKRANKFHLLILALIGLAVIGTSVYLLRKQFKSITQSPAPTPVEQTSPTPTPTPTPAPIDRSKFKIRVLNGTEKTGMAASVSAKLKDLGYQQEKSGNATNSAFQRTLVRVKTSTTLLLDQLIRDLSFQFDASSAGNLKDSDTADGEVILGLK